MFLRSAYRVRASCSKEVPGFGGRPGQTWVFGMRLMRLKTGLVTSRLASTSCVRTYDWPSASDAPSDWPPVSAAA